MKFSVSLSLSAGMEAQPSALTGDSMLLIQMRSRDTKVASVGRGGLFPQQGPPTLFRLLNSTRGGRELMFRAQKGRSVA